MLLVSFPYFILIVLDYSITTLHTLCVFQHNIHFAIILFNQNNQNLPPKDNNTKDICALKCIIRLPSSPSKQPSVFLNFPVPFNQVLHIKQLHIFRTPCSKLFRQLFQKENRDLFSSRPFIVSFLFPFAQPPLYDLDAFMLNNSKHNKIYSKKR